MTREAHSVSPRQIYAYAAFGAVLPDAAQVVGTTQPHEYLLDRHAEC